MPVDIAFETHFLGKPNPDHIPRFWHVESGKYLNDQWFNVCCFPGAIVLTGDIGEILIEDRGSRNWKETVFWVNACAPDSLLHRAKVQKVFDRKASFEELAKDAFELAKSGNMYLLDTIRNFMLDSSSVDNRAEMAKALIDSDLDMRDLDDELVEYALFNYAESDRLNVQALKHWAKLVIDGGMVDPNA